MPVVLLDTSAMQSSDTLIILTFILILFTLSIWYKIWLGTKILEYWEDKNGYQIIHREFRMFSKGPFLWQSSRNQVVYYVVIKDKRGKTHSGWVRCGSWVGGLLKNEIMVIWDDTSESDGKF